MGRITRTLAIIGLVNTLVVLAAFALLLRRERRESRIRKETRESVREREPSTLAASYRRLAR